MDPRVENHWNRGLDKWIRVREDEEEEDIHAGNLWGRILFTYAITQLQSTGYSMQLAVKSNMGPVP